MGDIVNSRMSETQFTFDKSNISLSVKFIFPEVLLCN